MAFEWDDDKNKKNQAKHGVWFDWVYEFDWASARYIDCSRPEDNETRMAAIGNFNGKLHTIILTYRNTDTRIISFRRSNTKEEREYENYGKKSKH